MHTIYFGAKVYVKPGSFWWKTRPDLRYRKGIIIEATGEGQCGVTASYRVKFESDQVVWCAMTDLIKPVSKLETIRKDGSDLGHVVEWSDWDTQEVLRLSNEI